MSNLETVYNFIKRENLFEGCSISLYSNRLEIKYIYILGEKRLSDLYIVISMFKVGFKPVLYAHDSMIIINFEVRDV